MSTLDFSIAKISGGVIITPSLHTPTSPADGSNFVLAKVSVLLNDVNNTSTKRGFVEKVFNHLNSDGTLIVNPTYELVEPDIEPGKTYLIRLRYRYDNDTTGSPEFYESNYKNVKIESVPQKPSRIDSSVIRTGDRTVSINIGGIYNKETETDGFNVITDIKVYISKISDETISYYRNISVTSGNYNVWESAVPSGVDLSNGEQYEIAFRTVNGVGESEISDTYVFTPSDLPSQITSLGAFNVFDDPLINAPQNVTNSLIRFYWAKPDDYDQLINVGLPVTRYIIRKQEMEYDSANAKYVKKGTYSEVPLAHDHNVTSSYALSTQQNIGNDITPIYVDYGYEYTFGSSDYGKFYQFTVYAENANGTGPESNTTTNVGVFISPSPQVFTIEHITESIQTTGLPVTKYTGEKTLVINSLSELNGTKENVAFNEIVDSSGVILDLDISGNTNKRLDPSGNEVTLLDASGNLITASKLVDASGNVFKRKDITMRLNIASNTASPTTVLANVDVIFQQEYTIASVANAQSKYLVTPTGKFKLTNLLALHSVLLTKGVSYRYSLYRIGIDPTNSATERISTNFDVIRIHFTSPDPPSKLQAFAIEDNFEPVVVNSSPGLRVVFEQITDASMNGCKAFGTPIEYELRSNSQRIPGLDRIIHNPDNLTPLEFRVASNVGVLNNLYIRVYATNPELDDAEIEGSESTPSVSDRAFDYPLAVTDLKITTDVTTDASGVDIGSMEISWNRQNGITGLKGSIPSDVFNIIYLYNETNSLDAVMSHEVPYNTPNTTAQKYTFNSVKIGDTYKVYVLAVRKYTQKDIDGTAKYTNALIRKNYVASADVVVGTPGKPTNVEAYHTSENITFYYDPVDHSELKGHNVNNFTYKFIVNSDHTYFPYQESTQTELQDAVVSVLGSSEAIIQKGYTSVSSSNDRNNATNLVVGNSYKYAIYVVSNIGGNTITNNNDELDSTSGTAITLVPPALVPVRSVTGELEISLNPLYISNYNEIPVVEVASQQNAIKLTIEKPPNAPSHLVITVNQGDASVYDASGNTITMPNFDTRNLISTTKTLFELESNYLTNPSLIPVGYTFLSRSINSTTVYDINVGTANYRLINGQTYAITVRFATDTGGIVAFGPAVTKEIAPEAPPTVPQNPTFKVDDKKIDLTWEPPSNFGGADVGQNGPLLYKVAVLLQGTTNQVENISNISDTYLTLNTSNFANITNGTAYSVQITAYYLKDGNTETPSVAAIIPEIRPNPAPKTPTVTVDEDDTKLIVKIVAPEYVSQTNIYPLTNIQVFYKRSTELSYNLADTISGSFTSKQILPEEIISPLLNGASYSVKVVCTPSYTGAQAPDDVIINNKIPFGVPTVTHIDTILGQPRRLKLTVGLNGSGDVTQVVGLGKTADSNAIGIINLVQTGSTLASTQTGYITSYTKSGAETATVAANQTAALVVDFGSTLNNTVSDAIFVVNTAKGSDAGAYSTSGASGHFSSGLTTSTT